MTTSLDEPQLQASADDPTGYGERGAARAWYAVQVDDVQRSRTAGAGQQHGGNIPGN